MARSLQSFFGGDKSSLLIYSDTDENTTRKRLAESSGEVPFLLYSADQARFIAMLIVSLSDATSNQPYGKIFCQI